MKYSKEQVAKAIEYWKNQLIQMNESENSIDVQDKYDSFTDKYDEAMNYLYDSFNELEVLFNAAKAFHVIQTGKDGLSPILMSYKKMEQRFEMYSKQLNEIHDKMSEDIYDLGKFVKLTKEKQG